MADARVEAGLVPAASARLGAEGCLRAALAGVLLLLGVLAWSYAPTLAELWKFWQTNEDYSAGMFVAPVALYLVWSRRAALLRASSRPCWWALGLVLCVELFRHAGIYFGFATAERISLVAAAAAGLLFVAGWDAARRLAMVLLFLLLMVPPPGPVHEAVAVPLQNVATRIAAVSLELLGFFVAREGNILRLDDSTHVGVTEACSGLRMLTAFLFTACVLAFIINRPTWHRVALLLSAVPIAVASNAIRMVATALYAHRVNDPSAADRFHDMAGLAMMPLGVLMSLVLLVALKWWDDAGASGAAAAQRGTETPVSSPVPAGGIGAWVAVAITAGVLVVSGVSTRQLSAAVAAQNAEVVELPRPLRSLPLRLGRWVGEEVEVSDGVQRIARNDDFVNRAYTAAAGERANLFVGYTAQPRTMLRHRPTICYPNAGWSLTHTRTDTVAVAGREVEVLVHRFLKPGLVEQRCVVVNYYVLAGELTVNEGRFWGPRWRAPKALQGVSRYVAQVQVMAPVMSDAEAAESTALRFVGESMPAILELLPGTAEFAAGPAP